MTVIDRDMIEALDQAWRRTSDLKKVTSEARDLFRRPLMPDELKRFDAAVIDPPRPEVKAAIEECDRAGIRVVMITGDHPLTSVAISR